MDKFKELLKTVEESRNLIAVAILLIAGGLALAGAKDVALAIAGAGTALLNSK